jgi:hypothetical protein
MALLPRWDRFEGDIGIYFRSVAGRRAACLGAILALDLIPLLVVADEFWMDPTAWLAGWPIIISSGLVPLALTLLGLAAIYWSPRLIFRARHGEALVGLFTFVAVGLLVLTGIGVFFRGPNMALVLPV